MQAAKALNFKPSSFDIVVARLDLDGLYMVSGKDAAVFHAKLMEIPKEAQDLIIGELKDGKFTLKKSSASGNAPTTTATTK